MSSARSHFASALIIITTLFCPSCESYIGQRYIFSGIVVDSETQNPVEGAFIEFQPDRQGLAWLQYMTLQTSHDGRFYMSVNGFEEGEKVTWRIYASAYNYFYDFDAPEANDLRLTTSDDNITLKLSPYDHERKFCVYLVYTNGITTNSRIECLLLFPGETDPQPMYPLNLFAYADILTDRDYGFYAMGWEVNTETQSWVLTCNTDTALRFDRESLSPLVFEVEFDDLRDTIMFRRVVAP